MPPKVEDVRFNIECVREGVSSKCVGLRRGEGGWRGMDLCSKGLRGFGRWRGGEEGAFVVIVEDILAAGECSFLPATPLI